MKKAFRILVALLLVGGWGLAASALHVIWTGSSVIVIPKDRIGLRETYVNVSHWTADDVSTHPRVANRLVAVGKPEVLSGAFTYKGTDDLIAQIQAAAARAPATQPSPTLMDKATALAHQATQVVQH